jgi:phage terminase large subunit
MIRLNIDKRVFNPIYYKYGLKNENSKQLYFGGASSGKSYFLAQRTVLDVLTGRNYLVVRKSKLSTKKSIFNEIYKSIYNFKVQGLFHINKSDLTITCKVNGAQVIFAGLDDPEKIKSVTAQNGPLTDIFIEEATEIDEGDYRQLTKRLRGFTKHKKRVTLAFNPVLKEHWIYKEFFSIWEDDKQYVEKDGVSILKTTYRDNKHLSKDDIEMLLSETDSYYREVYIEGNWGVLGKMVFSNYEVKEFDFRSFDNIRNGIDWGFSTDPFAFIRSHYDAKKRELYIFDELYLIDTPDLEAMKLVEQKLSSKREMIIADNAEPKSISLWKSKFFNIRPAKKGAGSIQTGIKFLQSLKIYIHPRCVNTKLEFMKYRWKEDRGGNALPTPVDKDNHLIDALRYSLEFDVVEKQNTTTLKPIGF